MRKSRARRAELALISLGIAGAIPSLAVAGETINYSYDAKGRVTANYSHDKADNRTNVTVTGSPNSPPP
jgi:YD repeat-containing protein